MRRSGNPAAVMVGLVVALVAVGVTGGARSAYARERLVRHFGVDQDLLPEDVAGIIQDADGFLWFGTAGGLVRYDGQRMIPWARDVIPGTVARLAVAPRTLIAVVWDGNVYRVRDETATLLVDPDGAPIVGAVDVWFDPLGRLWLPTRQGVLRSDDAGATWSRPLAGTDAARATNIRTSSDGTFYAITWDALWRLDGDTPTRVVELPHHPGEPDDAFVDLLAMPDGSMIASTWWGHVQRYRPGAAAMIELAQAPGVARSLARRGDVIWVAADAALLAIYPDHVEQLDATDDLANHGVVAFVDREGSLWVGNGRGAFQFPEPDTASWGVHDGIAAGNLRLAWTADGVWVTHWGYKFSRIAPAGAAGHRGAIVPDLAFHAVCTDSHGVLWGVRIQLGVDHAEVMSRAPGQTFVHRLDPGPIGSCSQGRTGVWLSGSRALWTGDGDEVAAVPAPPFDDVAVFYESASGTLWAAAERQICQARVAALRAGTDDWRCDPAAIDQITAIVETPSGAVWMASNVAGLARRAPEAPSGIAAIPGAAALPSKRVDVLEPAADGGLWIGGAGFLDRVEERLDVPAGWAVLETLGPDNGIPAYNPIDVLEDPSGTLWATTNAGVLEMPRSARHPAPAIVTPTLIAATFDGRRRDDGAPVRLEDRANTITLQVASLSYRDPPGIRYRVRLSPDAAWSVPAREPTIQLVDLPGGDYDIEVEASADEHTWVAAASTLAFVVDRPWYLRWTVWMTVALAVAAAAVIAIRVRRAVEQRLVAQREAIAMDLHDEVASGLGGIGLMAGLSADGAIDEAARRAAAERIAQTARTLGESLSGIVSALREDGGSLRAVAADVVERASILFPHERPRLVVAYPPVWPEVALDRGVARNLKLIVIEALHNAAKHAAATEVVLAAIADRDRIMFRIEDDGRGAVDDGRSGLGLVSMRRRARRIAADLTIASQPGGRGTAVVVALEPRRRTPRSEPRP